MGSTFPSLRIYCRGRTMRGGDEIGIGVPGIEAKRGCIPSQAAPPDFLLPGPGLCAVHPPTPAPQGPLLCWAVELQVAGLPPVIRNHWGPTSTPLTPHPGQDHLTGLEGSRRLPPASLLLARASSRLLEQGRERAARRLVAGDFTWSRYIWNPLFNH